VAPAHTGNDELIDRTIALWKPRLRRDLSREDARQIAENVTGFFAILAEWSRAEVRAPANHRGAPGPSRRTPTEWPPTDNDHQADRVRS
jgi:hypothetical protein